MASISCDFACVALFDPVCASNGETFSNACEFNQTKCATGDDTLEIVSQGGCSSGRTSDSIGAFCLQEFACLDVYTPVCGSDGRSYSNECFLRRVQCSDSTLTMASDGECRSSTAESGDAMAFASSTSGSRICAESVCTKEFRPLCGSDGVTYANQCLFQNAECVNSSLTFAFEGECTTTGLAGSASIAESGPTVGSDASITSDPSEIGAARTSRTSFVLISIVSVLLHVVVFMF